MLTDSRNEEVLPVLFLSKAVVVPGWKNLWYLWSKKTRNMERNKIRTLVTDQTNPLVLSKQLTRARAHKIHCASHGILTGLFQVVHHFAQYCFGYLAAPWLFDLHVLPDCSFRTFANRLFFRPRQHEQKNNLPLGASLPKPGKGPKRLFIFVSRTSRMLSHF